ncbi:hypothetical protein LX36DRAFT_208724 [Colletotrichum falcatum]|nr:hypothetical protein LX36DRAFT_208724 [Colletotrichum falcatum]
MIITYSSLLLHPLPPPLIALTVSCHLTLSPIPPAHPTPPKLSFTWTSCLLTAYPIHQAGPLRSQAQTFELHHKRKRSRLVKLTLHPAPIGCNQKTNKQGRHKRRKRVFLFIKKKKGVNGSRCNQNRPTWLCDVGKPSPHSWSCPQQPQHNRASNEKKKPAQAPPDERAAIIPRLGQTPKTGKGRTASLRTAGPGSTTRKKQGLVDLVFF